MVIQHDVFDLDLYFRGDVRVTFSLCWLLAPNPDGDFYSSISGSAKCLCTARVPMRQSPWRRVAQQVRRVATRPAGRDCRLARQNHFNLTRPARPTHGPA